MVQLAFTWLLYNFLSQSDRKPSAGVAALGVQKELLKVLYIDKVICLTSIRGTDQ